jgi:hypothetical protein
MNTPQQDLGCLYPLGCDMPESYKRLQTLMSDRNTFLFDTRRFASSGVMTWLKGSLLYEYGARYHRACKYLGSFYACGGPTRLVNRYIGVDPLVQHLRRGFNVVLLCECRSYEQCHRKVIVEMVREVLPEIKVIHPDTLDSAESSMV